MCLETLNMTIARVSQPIRDLPSAPLTSLQIWPITTPYIRTYRLPTPLLIFQIALIVGSIITGFLLSPFLVLSRNNAQRPVHRLRFPQEKERNRRYFALGFYVGAVLIVGTLVGFWTRWCLRNRNPWLWTIFWMLEGKNKWTRPALLAYWALLGSISIAGWSRQLARSRKYRVRSGLPAISEGVMPAPSTVANSAVREPIQERVLPDPAPSIAPTSGSLGMSFPTSFPNMPTLPNLPNLPNGANMTNVATDLLDAADKHVPTLSLNARRKFFHGLAVLMFIPGVAIDVSVWSLFDEKIHTENGLLQPAFTHLSFGAAFALFIFLEYVRYFAIYPFGAALHVFMNEFLDHKDSGTAILSHFYLLTGCAGSLWLDG